MIKKQTSGSYPPEDRRHQAHHISPEKIFLFSGETIVFLVLLFLVISNGGANEALHLWLPFVMAGIALFITSRVIK